MDKAERIYRTLPENQKDAFFELVLHPTKASAQVTELYITAGKNRLYASQGRASTNALAARVRELFQADADLTATYNHTLANGKWNHMMDQTHIGYTTWQEPPSNAMPKVVEIDVPAAAKMAVAAEGSSSLLRFDAFNQPRRDIDIFNKGKMLFEFSATASDPWIVLSRESERVWVSVDWTKAPEGTSSGSVKITGAGDSVMVKVEAFNLHELSLRGFVEADGYVSIEAEHYTKNTGWTKIDDYGRTLSSMVAKNAPESLEYGMYLFDSGTVQVQTIIAPTQNFVPGRGLRFAISFDDQPPRIIDALAQNSQRDWETTVKDSVRVVKSTHTLGKPGYHTLKVSMVESRRRRAEIRDGLGRSEAKLPGPPESYRNANP